MLGLCWQVPAFCHPVARLEGIPQRAVTSVKRDRRTTLLCISGSVAAALVATLLAIMNPTAGVNRPSAIGGYAVDGTNFYAHSSRTVSQPYSLRCTSVLHGLETRAFVTGDDTSSDETEIISSALTPGDNERTMHALVRDEAGDTLWCINDAWGLCPTGERGELPELLTWHPETRYETAPENERADRAFLFTYNLAREPRLVHRHYIERALDAAASGMKLVSNNRLEMNRGPSGAPVGIPLDPRYRAEDGMAFRTSRGRLAVVRTDGGYQDVNALYLLVDQPRLSSIFFWRIFIHYNRNRGFLDLQFLFACFQRPDQQRSPSAVC